jgi:hypothetical protein
MTKGRTSAQIKEAQAKRAKTFAAQTIVVDDHWSIIRFDEYNWQIRTTVPAYQQYKCNYYSKLEHALRALPSLMLQEEAKTDLKTLLKGLDGLGERIDRALKEARQLEVLLS